jgi:hypothetical protein
MDENTGRTQLREDFQAFLTTCYAMPGIGSSYAAVLTGEFR